MEDQERLKLLQEVQKEPIKFQIDFAHSILQEARSDVESEVEAMEEEDKRLEDMNTLSENLERAESELEDAMTYL